VYSSCGPLGGRGDSPAGGDETGSAVLGMAVKRLVRESGLKDRYHHTTGSCQTLRLCKQTGISLPQSRRSVLSALAPSTRIPLSPSYVGHRVLGNAQGTAQQPGLQEIQSDRGSLHCSCSRWTLPPIVHTCALPPVPIVHTCAVSLPPIAAPADALLPSATPKTVITTPTDAPPLPATPEMISPKAQVSDRYDGSEYDSTSSERDESEYDESEGDESEYDKSEYDKSEYDWSGSRSE
jgi:hypothetical protein